MEDLTSTTETEITRLGKIAWRSLLEEIQANMSEGDLSDEDIIRKFQEKFPTYSNHLVYSAVITSRNFLKTVERVKGLLTLDIYGEMRDIVFQKVINRFMSMDAISHFISMDARSSTSVIKAALQRVLPEHGKLAYKEAEKIAEAKVDAGYLYQPAYIVAKNISTERYSKPAFGLLILAVGFRLQVLEAAHNERIRRQKEAEEKKRKEEETKRLAARLAEGKRKEEEETRRRKEAEEKNRKREEKLKEILFRPRVPICRSDNRPLPPAIPVKTNEELALLNNGVIVFFNGEICRVEKFSSGQIRTHFLGGVRTQEIKPVARIVTEAEAEKTEEVKRIVVSPIKPNLVWVVFKREVQKLPTINHSQARDKSILEMGVGAVFAAENGDKHFPVYEVAKGGVVPIGTARRATIEEKRQAKGIAIS